MYQFGHNVIIHFVVLEVINFGSFNNGINDSNINLKKHGHRCCCQRTTSSKKTGITQLLSVGCYGWFN